MSNESKYRALLVECCEYLDRSRGESICSGSKLHTAMKEALAEPVQGIDKCACAEGSCAEHWAASDEASAKCKAVHPPAAQVAELVGALKAVVISAPAADCYSFHHTKKDQHHAADVCKPLARYEAAIDKARAALAKYKDQQNG